jgi:cytochrome c-type biogenesis protein CcmH
VLERLIFAVFLGFSVVAGAADAPSAAEDPVLEKRVTALTEELRCLVCQNQTVADSHAELAIDLKNQVREMLKQGKSEREIKDYMVQRYGDFVLYRPPVKSSTWVLWVGPFILLIGALAFYFVKLKQRGRRLRSAEGQISEEQHQRALALLAEQKSPGEKT